MNEDFQKYVEALHAKLELLINMKPVNVATMPKDAPTKAVYLFSENDKNLYVGRGLPPNLPAIISRVG